MLLSFEIISFIAAVHSMKSGSLTAGLLASSVAAFPHLFDKLGASHPVELRQINPSSPQGTGALPLVPPPFDAAAQRVSVSGANRVCAISRGSRQDADKVQSSFLPDLAMHEDLALGSMLVG